MMLRMAWWELLYKMRR